MPRNNEYLIKRNSAIQKRYKELSQQNYKGKRLYTYEAILSMLADEFYLTPDYIPRLLNSSLSSTLSTIQ